MIECIQHPAVRMGCIPLVLGETTSTLCTSWIDRLATMKEKYTKEMILVPQHYQVCQDSMEQWTISQCTSCGLNDEKRETNHLRGRRQNGLASKQGRDVERTT